MVPPLRERKAKECARILRDGVQCCGMESNGLHCDKVES